MADQEERDAQRESFLVNLVGEEVCISTPAGTSYGVVKEIDLYQGNLILFPYLIQDPLDDTFERSKKPKYISLAFFNKGNTYDVCPFNAGHLDKLIKARLKKARMGFAS